jgi:hypothetical protein
LFTLCPTSFDNYIQSAQDTLIDTTYSTKQEENITSEDMKYLSFVTCGDGGVGYFPPVSSSLETKKTWIEAMKELTPEEQMEVKSELLVEAQINNSSLDELTASAINDAFSQITSYQEYFQHLINEMEDQAVNATTNEERRDAEHIIEINKTIISVFKKNSIA